LFSQRAKKERNEERENSIISHRDCADPKKRREKKLLFHAKQAPRFVSRGSKSRSKGISGQRREKRLKRSKGGGCE